MGSWEKIYGNAFRLVYIILRCGDALLGCGCVPEMNHYQNTKYKKNNYKILVIFNLLLCVGWWLQLSMVIVCYVKYMYVYFVNLYIIV